MGVVLLVLAALDDCLLFLGVGVACLVFLVEVLVDLVGFGAAGGFGAVEAVAWLFLLGWKERRMLV